MINGNEPDEHEEEHEHSSPLDFPCDFVIKTMGKSDSAFEANTLAIIRKHFPTIRADQFTSRPSKNKKYLSISVAVHAQSKDQLDALYHDLSKEPTILMAL